MAFLFLAVARCGGITRAGRHQRKARAARTFIAKSPKDRLSRKPQSGSK
jgi:hypothetical protein